MTKTNSHKRNRVFSKIVALFLVLTVVAIFVVLHYALSRVTINIYSNQEDIEKSILVEIQPENSLEIAPEAVLGDIMHASFEMEATVPTTKSVSNSNKAGGYVTIYNNYSQDQPLIASTRLLTPDDKLFRLSESITVEAGEQVTVWAEADQEGEEYVTEATTFIIPGLWEGIQDRIYGESQEGMKLESIPRFSVTEQNIKAAEDKLAADAMNRALEIFNEDLSNKLKIDANRVQLSFETIESTEIGAESNQATIKQKVNAYGLVFASEDLKEIAESKFEKELNSNQALSSFKNTYPFDILEINLDNNRAVLEVHMTATIRTNDNFSQIDKDQIVGFDEAQLRDYLEDINIEDFEIEFFPFWVKKVPRLHDHIIIE